VGPGKHELTRGPPWTIPSATANSILLHRYPPPANLAMLVSTMWLHNLIMTAANAYYQVSQSAIPSPSRTCIDLTVSRHRCLRQGQVEVHSPASDSGGSNFPSRPSVGEGCSNRRFTCDLQYHLGMFQGTPETRTGRMPGHSFPSQRCANSITLFPGFVRATPSQEISLASTLTKVTCAIPLIHLSFFLLGNPR
jgi:hypothetical protein